MNLSIEYDNLVARIEPSVLPDDILRYLCSILRYRPDGYRHVYSFKSGTWDGYNYLFNIKDNTFRRGLLSRVVAALKDAGHNVTTKYTGREPPRVDHYIHKDIFRPYEFQSKAVEAATETSSGIIVSPTGTGKSVQIAMLLNNLKRYTIVLVTDVVLLDQMQQSLQRAYNQPIGIIGDGEFDIQNITVSTVQSLNTIKKAKSIAAADKRKDLIAFTNKVGAVISDEVHLSDTASILNIMDLFPNADRFIGFSATPYGWDGDREKRENLELEQHFGTVVFDTRKNNFVELGLKVPIYVQVQNRAPVKKDYNIHFKKNRFKGGKTEPDYTANYRECLENEILKNDQYHEEVAAYASKMASTGNSVFIHAAHSIEFGESIQQRIPGSMLVNGKTPRLRRREIYDAMRRKDLLVLVSDVGGTGLDIPSLNAIMLASDLQDIRQLKGRVERADKSPNATKEYGLLIDFHTNTQFLSKHFDSRKSQYDNDGHLVLG